MMFLELCTGFVLPRLLSLVIKMAPQGSEMFLFFLLLETWGERGQFFSHSSREHSSLGGLSLALFGPHIQI